MTRQVAELAEQAKGAASNIVRLVAHAMGESDEPTRAAAFDEEQEMILALIAAVIGADGFATHHEFVFASLMGKNLDDPGCCRAYLEEYAARWNKIAATTPSFVSAVLEYDARNRTNLTRRVVRELRTIVCCAAVVDGEDAACESQIAAEYLDRMDALFRRACWTVRWDEDSLPGIPLESTIGRDELRTHGPDAGPPERRGIV